MQQLRKGKWDVILTSYNFMQTYVAELTKCNTERHLRQE